MDNQKKEDDVIYEIIEQEKVEPNEGTTFEEDVKTEDEPQEDEELSLKNKSEDDDQEDEDVNENTESDNSHKKELTPEQRAKRNKKRAQERKRIRAQRLAEDKAKITQLEIRTRELEELLVRQDELSRNLLASEADKQIQDADYKLLQAERIIEAAVRDQNGTDFVQAQKFKELVLKEKLEAEHRKQQAQFKPPVQQKVSPILINKAIQFTNDYPWFDVNSNDQDSQVVTKIDQRLMQEGYDPESDLYWDELRTRVNKRFPNKRAKIDDYDDYEDDMEEHKPAKRIPVGGPPTSVTRDSGSSRTEYVHITPETKRWLQEWGVYDDPVKRERFIKEIAKQKKQQRN